MKPISKGTKKGAEKNILVQKHTVTEENSSEIPCQYSCVKCKKYYDNKKSLQSHIRLENEQKQIIKCEKCNKELKSSLERHMNKVFCGSGESYLLVDRKIKNKIAKKEHL